MPLIHIDWRPGRRQLRDFGLVAVVAFAGLGAWAFVRHGIVGIDLPPPTARTVAYALWTLAGLCGVLALTAPAALRPLFVALTVVGFPIGYVVSHAVLAFLFYGVLTPIGLVFRLMGRDAMERRFDASRASYWQPRERVTDPQRYFKQF
jgi:hypothetical protein